MLNVSHVDASYSKRGKLVLRDVSLELGKGEIGIILGPNGAGKSTLFQVLLGCLKPKAGNVSLNGRSLSELGRREWARNIAYVPQRIAASGLTVGETVMLGRMPYFGLAPGAEDAEKAGSVLNELGLAEFKETRTDCLSGGELQKVAIATALNQSPNLLLFDEPTSNLDVSNCVLFARLCKKLTKKGISVLIAMHDLNMALDLGDRFFFLKKGRVLASGGLETFNEENVYNTFGVDVAISDFGGDKHIHFHHKENVDE